MAVGLNSLKRLLPVAGIRIGISAAGIKYENRNDITLIELAPNTSVAGVFTKNLFCAAPVVVAKKHLANTDPKYLLINTGNANAGTGEQGMQAAMQSCDAVASLGQCDVENVLPFSTGVIGEPLPADRIVKALPETIQNLKEDNWMAAASAILTTDTMPKGFSKKLTIGSEAITITGISKGSGMIRPDMATMLAYIATDAKISVETLQEILTEANKVSFNAITVDGDTSTNDACIAMATGKSGVVIEGESKIAAFSEVFVEAMQHLAQSIIRDGEGATKFISVNIENGKTFSECEKVAYCIAHSPLVKTAFFASDPNWGRILAAIGRAGVDDLIIDDIAIKLNDVEIVTNGGRSPQYTEEKGQAVMDEEEIAITVDLSRGDVSHTVWTTDLSYDYVKINAEYRT